jgi:CRISPR-associated endonuclease Csn1
MSEQLRYRIGIDVGLYSVGLAAIEIDDSDPNPLNAFPLRLLSIKSVIHDGAIDPDSNKTADS